jgi:hypothetical protein
MHLSFSGCPSLETPLPWWEGLREGDRIAYYSSFFTLSQPPPSRGRSF